MSGWIGVGWPGAGWIGQALVASTLLMVLVLLVRGAARRAFGAAVAYALWALPALRLMLPPLPGPIAVAAPIAAPPMSMTILVVDAGPAAPVALGTVLTGVWLLGAAAFLGWQLVFYARFRRRLERGARPVATLAGVRVIASSGAAGPLAIGIRRRTIAVPADWTTRFSGPERDLALAHELAHHDRHDLLANAAALLVLALHWFDPIAWIAYRAFRADQEQAADARVLARHGPAAVPVYARAIVAAAAGRALSPACHLNTLAHLKRRLAMLTRHRPSRRRLVTGAALATGLTLAGLGVTASRTAAATEARTPAVAPTPTPTPMQEMAAMPAMPAMQALPEMQTMPAVPSAPATPPASGQRQARTIVIRPGKGGGSTLIVRRTVVPAGGSLPAGVGLPATFVLPAGCKPGDTVPPQAMVIKGGGGEKTYTIVCTRAANVYGGSAAEPTERDSYQQALVGLRSARSQIVAQAGVPDVDRRKALAAIDLSMTELQDDLARTPATPVPPAKPE